MRDVKKKIFSSEEFSFRLEIVSSGGIHVRSIKGLVPSLMSPNLIDMSCRLVLLQLSLMAQELKCASLVSGVG